MSAEASREKLHTYITFYILDLASSSVAHHSREGFFLTIQLVLQPDELTLQDHCDECCFVFGNSESTIRRKFKGSL